ncbi:MAG TPA: glycosyl hydrolase family 28 protein [Opitutaceae bacterium]|nr:glycosyl hydrolase family 28 protein [Opitutaceae bacterium]
MAFKPGTYLTGALFLKGNVEFRVDTGVTLRGTKDLAAYPRQWTRVAGIEMMWPAALLNICDARNVKVSGGGTIDGDGAASWSHYAAMVRQYEARGLRWVVDYDCERIRLLQVWRSSDVTVQDVHLRRSGFWTVQVCYSEHVTVSGISIHDNAGPSTDGVDVDSSRYVLVQDCDIDNNDDCICLKAGRDADGLRVNRPTEYVLIRDNLTRRGSGMVTFGSETSGGIRHVLVERNRALGTAEGIRFKSARTRGGYVRDVVIRDVTMTDVPSPFTITLDWFPSYSYAATNADWSGSNVPAHWKVLTTPVTPPERGWCRIEDVSIENVRITGANQIFTASGLPGDPVRDIRWRNVTAEGKRAGRIEYASGWSMRDVTLSTPAPDQLVLANCTDMTVPSVRTKP